MRGVAKVRHAPPELPFKTPLQCDAVAVRFLQVFRDEWRAFSEVVFQFIVKNLWLGTMNNEHDTT